MTDGPGPARSPTQGEALSALAKRMDLAVDWDALPLPEGDRERVRELLAQARLARAPAAGVRPRRPRIALVGGDPEDRARAAAAIARALDLTPHRVDLAALTSKYIGETEKNLERLFAAAEASDAALVFDQGDTLFGKRTGVRDGDDRHAGIEVRELVERLDACSVLAILGSDSTRIVDSAGASHFDCVVQLRDRA
jgi:SpoVK/Ycf46/Vps4 family AAA+-type ATPase